MKQKYNEVTLCSSDEILYKKWLTLAGGTIVGSWNVKVGTCCCTGGCAGGPANNCTTDASIADRHRGHSLFCAWTFDARHCRWNLWLHDNVNNGEPGARALRQIEQSSVVFDDIVV